MLVVGRNIVRGQCRLVNVSRQPFDLQAAAEQERVAAGLQDYAPGQVPPAADPVPEEASDEADRAQRGLRDNPGTDV